MRVGWGTPIYMVLKKQKDKVRVEDEEEKKSKRVTTTCEGLYSFWSLFSI